jgi:hypothetical protein
MTRWRTHSAMLLQPGGDDASTAAQINQICV